ncbi:MAG TPA: 6-bladed beta-propeller [Chloroflexota bacterium]
MSTTYAPASVITERSSTPLAGPRPRPLFDVYDPEQLARLRQQERLDEVCGRGGDIERLARLRGWVRSQWEHTIPDPPPPHDALTHLDWIRKGKTGGFCGNFNAVFVQCCAALGFYARSVGINKQRAPDGTWRGGHAVAEVWSPEHGRWVLMDTDFDLHYSRRGQLLAALDLHRAWVTGTVSEVLPVEGAPLAFRYEVSDYGESHLLELYYNFRVIVRNPALVGAPGYADDVYELQWVDAETEPLPDYVTSGDPADFYPALDEVEIDALPGERSGELRLSLGTYAPGFRHFLVQVDGGAWRPVDGSTTEDGTTVGEQVVRGDGPATDVVALVLDQGDRRGRPARLRVANRPEAVPPRFDGCFGRPGKSKDWTWLQLGFPMPETIDGEFRYPAGIGIGPDGMVYVVDRQNHRVQCFTPEGVFVRTWGSEGGGPDRLRHPQGLAISADGTVFVADMLNGRIQLFDPAGRHLGQIGRSGGGPGEFRDVHSIALDRDGNLYATDSDEHGLGRVQRFARDGSLLGAWGEPGEGPGQFRSPTGVALAPDGSVYVVDSGNCRVQRFDRVGRFLATWGEPGEEAGRFRYPAGVAVDHAGLVYVVDARNRRVQRFDAAGRYLARWTVEPRDGEPGLQNPRAIAIGSGDRLFVTDADSHRVFRFRVPGKLGEVSVSAAAYGG